MKKFWDNNKDKYILDNATKITWSEMADYLGCSIPTVQNRARKLGVEFDIKNVNRWTDEEVELLREYSKKYVGKTIAKKLNKSYVAVQKKALKEGIEINYKKDIWKKWMVYYLKDNIDKQSIRQIAMFLGLSEYQVRKKCIELGLEHDNGRWSKDEEKILLDNYDKCHYSELTKLLPDKSKMAIFSKARTMNLNIITESYVYDHSIEEYILKNWSKKSINEIARTLGIPRSRVYNYKEKLGLPNKGQNIKWNEANIKRLRKLASQYTIDELARKFKTTNSAISTIASKENIELKNGKIKYSKDEIDRVRELAKTYTLPEVSEMVNIPLNNLGYLVKRFKIQTIKTTNSWTNEEIELLRLLDGKSIYEMMASINKVDTTIISKCDELNISYIKLPRKEWTDIEIEQLKEDSKKMCMRDLTIKYKRSSSSISSKLNNLGLKTNSNINYWSEDDLNTLRQLAIEGKSIDYIAKQLSRTFYSVKTRLSTENIVIQGNTRFWSKEDEDFLEDYYTDHTITYLAKKLGRTESAIVNKAYQLGLKEKLYHPEAIKISEIAEFFNVSRHEVDTTWCILGLPYKTQKISGVASYRYVLIEDLFNFLENNQFLFDGKDLEENILGMEPEWVKQKRKHDYRYGFDNYRISLVKKKLLQEKKYYLEMLKEENMELTRVKKDI